MRVMFCWWTFEGYFAACWRALAARHGFELKVLALRPELAGDAPFGQGLLKGLDAELLTKKELSDRLLLTGRVVRWKPDVVVVPGWVNPAAVRMVHARDLTKVAVVMASDRPRKHGWGELRQRLGALAYRRFLDRIDRMVVPGERGWQLGRLLGVPESKLERGMYGVEAAPLASCWEERAGRGGWPRVFLYVGRYSEEKGPRVLAEAYRRYRATSSNPWKLNVAGRGALKVLLEGAGAEDMGFVPPERMWGVWANAGVLIMPSHRDAWGQAIVEGAASGLPVICTNACGASVEVVRDGYNGWRVPASDAEALARAMLSAELAGDRLMEMGRRSRELAAAYDTERWADRWEAILTAAVLNRTHALRGTA